MGKYDERPYEVGKGKPPKQHRFKPGQSGNPRGPKRKAKDHDATMTELLAEILNEPVGVAIGGQTRKMSKKQAILMSLVHDAANGTPAQRLKVVNSLIKIGAFDLTLNDIQPDPISAEERAQTFIRELAAEIGYDTDTGTFDDPAKEVLYR